FANHGPMAAQALVDLGHQALIPAFVDRYAPRLPPARPGRAMDPAEQGRARGDFARASDWVATFEARLAEEDWRACVREVVPPLLPGLFAAAGHGLLRTVHAMRALEREDSPLRRRELARGLAHWSARDRRLPGEPTATAQATATAGASATLGLADAFASMPPLPTGPEPEELFVDAVARLEAFAPFRGVVGSVTGPAEAEVDAALAALVRAAARVYLERPEARIAYTHAITIPAAMRWLAGHLAPADARIGAVHAFQAAAALHALYGGTPRAEAVDDEVAKTAASWDEIRYRAACSIEEHATKLACACWLEAREADDPVLAQAAADAALRIDGSRSAVRC
ncbi:questin oxidase family protein, partial [Myxococcota bacterium]|nr:questin oxidase family protein [Myxococcota bacterium]